MTETPILDLEQDPSAPAKRLLGLMPVMCIGIAVGVVAVIVDPRWPRGWMVPAFNGFLFSPALYLAIAVHEIGHLLFARFAGIDVGGITVGVLGLARCGGRWRVRWNWSNWFGGSFVPGFGGPEFQLSQLAWMIVGGPVLW